MMMSTKQTLPTLALVLVVFTVFTVSLTENLQIADGFRSHSTAGWVYELNPGESQVLTWTLVNTEEQPINIEFSIENDGSEFFIFEKVITFEAKETKPVDFIVSIPDTHPDNVEYRVVATALEKAPASDGGAAAVLINYEMFSHITIKIGDNPVFTPEPEPVKVEEESEPIVEERPKEEDFTSAPEPETIEQKLKRIQEANQANTPVMGETPAEATGQFEVEDPVPELQVDDSYIEEPVDVPDPISMVEEEGGGCLIATATFGSELAPQVQLLREIRDNQLMGTGSGIAFMSGFNSLYYSFSPVIADMERESPAFKELVKLTITPMISTLSIMEHAENESEVLGLGIGVILMNLGMYVGLPTFGIVKLIQFRKN